MKYYRYVAFFVGIQFILGAATESRGQTSGPGNPGNYERDGFAPPRFIKSAAVEQEAGPGASARPSSPAQVVVAQTAQVSCIHKIQLSAQADGLIQELLVDEGSVVTKGDPILIIDSRVAQAELEVANKQLESAQIIAAQTANIEFSKAARDLAIEEFKAEKELLLKSATTEAALKRKQLEMKKTMFSVDMATDEQKKYQLEAAVAQEQVNASKVKLELYKVVAPYDGIVVERKRDFGEWIRAGEPVVRLLHLNEMKVEAFVPLDGVSLTSLEGAEMNIQVPMGPGSEPVSFRARVGFVSPELDTRTVRVTTRVQNQQVGGSWILRDGMSAYVEIIPNL